MKLTVLPLTSASDIPTIARIHLAAFLTNKFYRTVWYKGATPAVIESQESRHLNFLTSDPTVRYAKVVEHAVSNPGEPDSTNEETIIAFAKWHIYTTIPAVGTRQDAEDRSWPPDCNVPCVEDFWSKLQAVRHEWGPKLGPHLMLDILATDPSHMRRGAGKMLMKFGTDMADEAGLPCFLEGSPEGLGLYRASGFEVVGWIWVDLKKYQDAGEQTVQGDQKQERDEGEGEGWYSHAVMVRQHQPGKGTSASN
jgi:GNAT superfamily N-acetyltransferase